MKNDDISRRKFLEQSALTAAQALKPMSAAEMDKLLCAGCADEGAA